MFKKYLLIFRQIFNNKLFTTLNVLGLSIGIAAAWIIFQLTLLENSYDKGQPDRERIYQVYMKSIFSGKEGTFGGVPRSVYPALLNDLTGIELITPIYYQFRQSLKVQNDQGVEKSNIATCKNQVATTPDIFKLLNYDFLAGDQNSCLLNPDQIVISESRANLYFPKQDPENIIGKTLIFDDTIQKQVSAVVRDLDYLNSFQLEEFVTLDKSDLNNDEWSSINSNDLLFVKLKEGYTASSVLSPLNKLNLDRNKESFEKYNYKSWFEFLPLADKHFTPNINYRVRGVSKNLIWGLVSVSLFLLLLGCINYTNLSTAQIPQRAKSIGIRKTLGSKSTDIIRSFLGETLIITCIATVLAIIMSHYFAQLLSDFLPKEYYEFNNYGYFIGFALVLITLLTLLSGIYPAWLTTKLNTISILKGQVTKQSNPKKFNLRKSLIVFQFIVAQFFIICAIVIGQQMQYSYNKDLGFNKDAIVSIKIPYEAYSKDEYKNKQFVLKEKLASNPNILQVSLGDAPMSNDMLGYVMEIHNDTGKINGQFNIKHIDENYLETYEMKLIAGRNIQHSDSTTEYLINESALEKYGFKDAESAIGKVLSQPEGKAYPIVGVVSDFHLFGFQEKIQPTLLLKRKSSLNTINIKLPINQMAEWPNIMKSVKDEWNNIYAGFNFTPLFYDEIIESLYKDERKIAFLVKLATGISIFISCLGLFGLSTITVFQRSKELGIRKVLGATIPEIVSLLSKEFVLLISISIIIASPLAWWMMNKWLEDYAFKIEISAWIFLFAGIITILFALITISYQSIKAARANPVNSLRDE